MNGTNFTQFDQQMMQSAIDLAYQGYYSTKPNPAVGCVLVKNEIKLAEGWHHEAGKPHAERVALKNALEAGQDLQGATAYVTLEPCAHFGKTPPCANALVEAGIARLVVAMLDPNPLVSGGGIKICQEAGILVEIGLLSAEAKNLNKGFLFAMENKKPYVRLKMAASLDGRTAMESGESHWITGEEARQEVHKMRAKHGAIVTGIGTVLADDPSMNVRLSDEMLADMQLTQDNCHPIRVVLDANLSMPMDAKMLTLPGRTVLISSKQTIEDNPDLVNHFIEKGTDIVAVSAEGDRLDLESVLSYLYEAEQVTDVMVEAGAVVAGAFIQAGLVNEVHAYVAPILMGNQAKPMFSLPNISEMSERISLKIQKVNQVGEDLHLVFSVEG